MKSLVILGAGGYIGTRLAEKLSKRYSLKILLQHKSQSFPHLKNTKIFYGDILKSEDVEVVVGKGDIVINLAGTTSLPQPEKNHFDINVIGQQIVAEICAKKNARIIYFSTESVYSSGKANSLETDFVIAQDAYSFSKKLAEEVYEFYSRKYGLSAIVFRLGSVYGPGQKKGIVFNMFNSLKERGVIEIPKEKVMRDLIYIDDVIQAVEKAIAYKKTGFHLFNIASDNAVTLADLAEIICEEMQKETGQEKKEQKIKGKITGKIVKVNKKSYPAIVHASIKKAKKELKFSPKVALQDGLQKTLLSYKI